MNLNHEEATRANKQKLRELLSRFTCVTNNSKEPFDVKVTLQPEAFIILLDSQMLPEVKEKLAELVKDGTLSVAPLTTAFDKVSEVSKFDIISENL